jgi:hypothetical protein
MHKETQPNTTDKKSIKKPNLLTGIYQAGIILVIVGLLTAAIYRNKEALVPEPAPSIGLQEALLEKDFLLINVSDLPIPPQFQQKSKEPNKIIEWKWKDKKSQWKALDETLKNITPQTTVVIWANAQNERVKYVATQLRILQVKNLRVAQAN